MRFPLLVCILPLLITQLAIAQSSKKYALLAGVTKYEQPGMNKPQLEYPEIDAKELAELLVTFGYDVDLLLGKEATQAAFRKKLAALRSKGEEDGVVLIGLFGHGTLMQGVAEQEPEACFCPYDTPMRIAKGPNGKPLIDDDGEPVMTPDPSKVIKVAEILAFLKNAKARNRIVLAECCRKAPIQAKGKNLSVGAKFKVSDIPENTAMLFGCSPDQQEFECGDEGHGAFSKCLLDELRNIAKNREIATTTLLADRLEKNVPQLLATKNLSDKQIPKLFSTASIDLQLAIPKGLDGTRAGERRDLMPGVFFRWCPPGKFMMGDDGSKVNVELTTGFWLCETELTQSQWQKLMKTTPWSNQNDVEERPDYPAQYLSHDDAVSYCKDLTSQERNADRLPKGWIYSLPTEAQWEYACRAGTKTKYWSGRTDSELSNVAWMETNTSLLGEKHPHRVGQKKANPWGLQDMHGNVAEWCSNWFTMKLEAGQDPRGPLTPQKGFDSGMYRMIRGGAWINSPEFCRSAFRHHNPPEVRSSDVGFRLAVLRIDDE